MESFRLRPLLICGFLFVGSMAFAKEKCIKKDVKGVLWNLQVCHKPEVKKHFPSEVQVRKKGQVVFRTMLWDDPTGGYADINVLHATTDLLVFESPGDEVNQVIAVNLKDFKIVINTGKIAGLGECRRISFPSEEKSNPCSLSLQCAWTGPSSEPGAKLSLHEMICPPQSRF